jgi:hypothetical protein
MKNSLTPKSIASMRALRLITITAALTLAGTASAQNNAAPNDPNAGGRRQRGGGTAGQDAGNGGRGNFNPEDMQARMLTALRERLGVTDDEEWNLISKRLSTVTELRRSAGGGGGGFLGGGGRGGPPGGGDTGGRGGRGPGGRGGSSNPEVAALQAAITDNLPEAEIKSRLERVREARRDNEAKLLKAQEDLRALLSVKQEATAVLFGLLP